MAFNASIVTDVAKEITKREVVNYGAGVYSHTTGDWSGHNVLRVYPSTPFEDDSGADVSTATLRIVATLDDGSAQGLDLAFALPVNQSGETALTSAPPIIVRQPASQTAPPGAAVQLSVAVISDVKRWRGDGGSDRQHFDHSIGVEHRCRNLHSEHHKCERHRGQQRSNLDGRCRGQRYLR